MASGQALSRNADSTRACSREPRSAAAARGAINCEVSRPNSSAVAYEAGHANSREADEGPIAECDLNIVLVGENIKYTLSIPRPPFPNNTAVRHDKDVYDHWVASNNKAIAYMLASMSDVLRAKFENHDSAVKILDSLQEMFGQKNEQSYIEITRKYTTTTMKTGTLVRDYVIMMTNYFTKA